MPFHSSLFYSTPFHSTPLYSAPILFLSFPCLSIYFHFTPLERNLLLELTDLIVQYTWCKVWKILHQTMFISPKGCTLMGLLSVNDLTFSWWHLFCPMYNVPLEAWYIICFLNAHGVKLTTLLRKSFSSLLLLLRLSTIPKECITLQTWQTLLNISLVTHFKPYYYYWPVFILFNGVIFNHSSEQSWQKLSSSWNLYSTGTHRNTHCA